MRGGGGESKMRRVGGNQSRGGVGGIKDEEGRGESKMRRGVLNQR